MERDYGIKYTVWKNNNIYFKIEDPSKYLLFIIKNSEFIRNEN
jgi:hypothetical protein